MSEPNETVAEDIRQERTEKTAERTKDTESNTAADESSDKKETSGKGKASPTDEPPHRKGWLSGMQPKTVFFGALAVMALVCFIIAYNESFGAFIDRIFSLISPILIGCVLAYLCHPLLEFFEYRLFRRMKNRGLRRGLSLLLTVLSFFAIIVLFILLIVPELVSSIQTLISNYDAYANSLLQWFRDFVSDFSAKTGTDISPTTLDALIDSMRDAIGSLGSVFATVGLWLSKIDISMEVAGDVLMSVVNFLKDTVLSLFIAFYILASLDKRKAQIRKFRRAVFNQKQNRKITEFVRLTDRTFSGFLFSILIDALVVGVLTFAMMSIFEVSPYNMLIASIIAVTNVIPVFGPFLGAIPSAFIVLITNPPKLLLFIILMLIIQQVDGNILCPKIQGDNTGVSSLSVLIAITLAGSLWGIMGMVIGVPIFAVFIELGKRIIEDRLKAKNAPTDTAVYYSYTSLANAEKDVHYDHAGLRYEYEHSRFKERVDRFRRNVLRIGRTTEEKHASKDAKKTPPNAKKNTPSPSAEAPTSNASDKDGKPDNQ